MELRTRRWKQRRVFAWNKYEVFGSGKVPKIKQVQLVEV